MLSPVLFHLRVAMTPARPPTGNAIAGSMAIPNNGRRTIRRTATSGPVMLAINDGKSVLALVSSASFISEKPLSGSIGSIMNISAARPTNAGTIPAAITDDSGASKFSAAMMVLGFGETIFPHFPPPIIAKSTFPFERPISLPIMMAIGATVITATSIKTPTPVSINTDNANARKTLRRPAFLTMVSAILSAEPVLTNTPVRTPSAKMLTMAGDMSFTPENISLTVKSKPHPESKPLTIAPRISA